MTSLTVFQSRPNDGAKTPGRRTWNGALLGGSELRSRSRGERQIKARGEATAAHGTPSVDGKRKQGGNKTRRERRDLTVINHTAMKDIRINPTIHRGASQFYITLAGTAAAPTHRDVRLYCSWQCGKARQAPAARDIPITLGVPACGIIPRLTLELPRRVQFPCRGKRKGAPPALS